MKLLGSTKIKVTKDKNAQKVPHLEITEVVLVHCNIVNNDYQQDSRVLYTFVPNKPWVVYWKLHQQIISFSKHLKHSFNLLEGGLQTKLVNH